MWVPLFRLVLGVICLIDNGVFCLYVLYHLLDSSKPLIESKSFISNNRKDTIGNENWLTAPFNTASSLLSQHRKQGSRVTKDLPSLPTSSNRLPITLFIILLPFSSSTSKSKLSSSITQDTDESLSSLNRRRNQIPLSQINPPSLPIFSIRPLSPPN